MSEPIRVLHCVVNMNRGGAETLIMNIYRNIDRSKIQFDFLTSIEGVFDDEIRSLGGNIYRIEYITKSGPVKYAKDIYNLLREHNYKIIHSHMDRMSGIMMREANGAGIPVRIAHSHNTQSEGGVFVRLIKKYYSRYLIDATNYFACSEAAAKFMFSKEVSVIKNGVDTSGFIYNLNIRDKQRKEYKVENKMVIGHVARFNKQKNHTFLIDIFNEVHKRDKDTVLILVGKGELQESIKEKVENLCLQHDVIFLGSCGNVNEILQMFDLFLFPSLFEGLPLTVIEAQASGLKCVLSDTITREADISSNVEFIPLSKSSAEWADEVLKYKAGYERKDMSDVIRQSGYDIKGTAKMLEEFYLDEYRKQT